MANDTRRQKTQDDVQNYYICGQCKDKQRYLVGEDKPIPCPDCGWQHGDRKKYDVPDEIRIDLNRY